MAKTLVTFSLVPRDRRERKVTREWYVKSSMGYWLGQVKWYAPWRRYVYEPDEGLIVLDATCLRTIADFCEKNTVMHKVARRRLKERVHGGA